MKSFVSGHSWCALLKLFLVMQLWEAAALADLIKLFSHIKVEREREREASSNGRKSDNRLINLYHNTRGVWV
jgi:hypothetical protein